MAMGYLLSFLRYTLPEALGITHYGGGFDFLSFIWEVDILQFAGFALIILAMIRRWIPWLRTWILLSVLITVSAPLLWGIDTGILPFDWLLDLFWGNYEEVWFPIFPWLAFPLLGMAFSRLIRDQRPAYTVRIAGTLAEARILLGKEKVDIVICDFYLG